MPLISDRVVGSIHLMSRTEFSYFSSSSSKDTVPTNVSIAATTFLFFLPAVPVPVTEHRHCCFHGSVEF